MIYIGIDPGKSGGIAWNFQPVSGRERTHAVVKMPETPADIWGQLEQLASADDCCAVIEHVHAGFFGGGERKMGVTSAFKFGETFGILRACLIGNKIAFEEVSPTKWQRAVGVAPRGKKTQPEHKRALKALAQERFPHAKVTLSTCDALLLAQYCYQTRGNNGND
jgi:hypothetical protein